MFSVAQWSVRPRDVEACEEALGAIADHLVTRHPGVKSLQVFRLPRPALLGASAEGRMFNLPVSEAQVKPGVVSVLTLDQ